MKSIWREIVLSVIMGMVLPGIVMNWAVEETVQEENLVTEGENISQQPEEQCAGMQMRLRRNEAVQTMEMDEYLVGVLLGEMPASFELEAKKAQAVAARTFVCRAQVTGGKHGDGSVCDDSACCQAYCPAEEYLEKGGNEEAVRQARRAAESTGGYVLTYGGQIIEATYFSCSGGSTEDAVAVWGTDVPYLRAVQSPGEEKATHYTDTVYFLKEEFLDKLGLNLTGSPEEWLGKCTYTAGNGVQSMVIGGKTYEGTQLRSLLGLRSTVFSMKADAGGITVTTRGFGHRVGLSQYGADAMAVNGSGYEEILAHYYPGTTLELTNGDG